MKGSKIEEIKIPHNLAPAIPSLETSPEDLLIEHFIWIAKYVQKNINPTMTKLNHSGISNNISSNKPPKINAQN